MKTLTRDKRRFLTTILCLSLLLSFCFAFTAQAPVVAAREDGKSGDPPASAIDRLTVQRLVDLSRLPLPPH
jgi:hypothetical protein